MSKPIRLAIIGGGMISELAHLPAALECPDIEVVALVDPVRARIARLARRFAISPLLASDVSEIVDQVDAALVATPNDTHAPIALRCIAAGVPVLVEKPLAASLADARAIATAGSAHGVLVAPGYVTRFRPNLRLLKRLLDLKYFGRIRRFVHQFGTVGGWAPLSAYNLARKATGGGVLMVTATHFVDRLIWFWGVPSGVSYWDDSCGGPEANCVVGFRYEGAESFDGEARYSKTFSLPGGLVIEAERGTVMLADTDDAEILFQPQDAPGVVHAVRASVANFDAAQEPFALQLRAFARACRNETTFPVSVEESLQSLELIERLYACRQPLPDTWYETAS